MTTSASTTEHLGPEGQDENNVAIPMMSPNQFIDAKVRNTSYSMLHCHENPLRAVKCSNVKSGGPDTSTCDDM